MSLGPVQKSVKEIASAHSEVEFALVLARTIDSASRDPEQLRGAIYELARQKLQQLCHDDASEKARLMQALEVAIAGVEAYTRGNVVGDFPPSSRAGHLQPIRSNAEASAVLVEATSPRIGTDRHKGASIPYQRMEFKRDDSACGTPRLSSSTFLRFLTILMCVAAVGALIVLRQRGVTVASLRNLGPASWFGSRQGAPKNAETPAISQPAATPQASGPKIEPKKSSLLPTSYGVYAENGGKLYDLEMLQGRAPDPRIALSAAIAKPSGTILPDGHLKFIVFHRDAGREASDPIEVRVVARLKQATAFDPTGKPVVAPVEDVWVIRNISFPYRAGPVNQDPQMFEIEARDPAAVLTPGRYALVLRGQAFDFSVEGTVTDKRQCLERLAAANGVFYSECQLP